jgi:PadR family transcriptional regulator AphA
LDVKTLCLGVLTFGEASGYDIKKSFEDDFSHFFVAGFGSIYPALAELAADGLIEGREETQAGRPSRKVYQITETGRDVFLAALARTEPRHKIRSEFFVLLYFAHLLTPDRLAQVLAKRASDVERDLALIGEFEQQAATCTPGMNFAVGLAKAVLEATARHIDRHGDALLAATTSGATASRCNTNDIEPPRHLINERKNGST